MSDERRAWVASTREAGWHAVPITAGGGSLVVACGRRVYGPFHRRIGANPPEDHRSVCQACAQAVGWEPPRLPRPHPAMEWPTRDPDGTRRRPDLAAALDLLSEEQAAPGRWKLPGTTSEPTELAA